LFDSFEGQQFELDSHLPLGSQRGYHRVRSDERANVARDGGAPSTKPLFPDGLFELRRRKKRRNLLRSLKLGLRSLEPMAFGKGGH